MDLYRLSGEPRDLVPLNLDHVFANCVSLIEWPSRLGDRIPADRLEISMRIAGGHDDDFETEDKLRTVTLQPYGSVWEGRLQQLLDDRYVDDLLVDNDD
jgi:tRNA A37 threonylcarbamoyladenosine biosynthesis protein TsaE